MKTLLYLMSFLFLTVSLYPQEEVSKGYPVIIDSDTIFYVYSGIGGFTAAHRADALNEKLSLIADNDTANITSFRVAESADGYLITYNNKNLFAVTGADAEAADTTAEYLAAAYKDKIVSQLLLTRDLYSQRSLLINALYTIGYIAMLAFFFIAAAKTFPWLYEKIRHLDKNKVKPVLVKGKEVLQSSTIVSTLILTAKGLRIFLTLGAVYMFLIFAIQIWPHTRKLEVEVIIKGVVFFIFFTILLIAAFRGINAVVNILKGKYVTWKGTLIRPVRIKTIEILSAERTIEIFMFFTKVFRFIIIAISVYFYITAVFSLFEFSKHWAATLFDYILHPLGVVINSFLTFLPDLFFIIVLVIVFNYVIRFVKFFFLEVDKGNIDLPGFHKDWAMPTYKIARFLILVLAAIVIFPYLPGSDSPFFQGISVFLGILFSFGSTSAISNIVSGIVITYMRPFKVGDRVKIAETTGDVIEKTLLVTRIRSVKNVDITIPNSMVLNSHIINYSSSAKEMGLILNTTVTIGYDVPWKKVHELLLSAASETERLLKDPRPFVLQTSLDDFYVSYELNVYTSNPEAMSRIYSELHGKIQDKFNEAGVEIMSPHYSAARDGNQTTVPESYLPVDYKTPAFRFLNINFPSVKTKDNGGKQQQPEN